METLSTVIYILSSCFMVLVVLVQGGNQGGVGAAFGGGNTQGVFGATGATTLLGKLTYAAAACLMISSLALTIIKGRLQSNVGLLEKIEQQQTAPLTPAAPPEMESTVPQPETGTAAP